MKSVSLDDFLNTFNQDQGFAEDTEIVKVDVKVKDTVITGHAYVSNILGVVNGHDAYLMLRTRLGSVYLIMKEKIDYVRVQDEDSSG